MADPIAGIPQSADWTPSINQKVRIIIGGGIFTRILNQEGVVDDLYPETSEARVSINRQTYRIPYIGLAPVEAEQVVTGSLAELLTRITRLTTQLKEEMRSQAVVGFGDGAKWRADIEGGKLHVWETTA